MVFIVLLLNFSSAKNSAKILANAALLNNCEEKFYLDLKIRKVNTHLSR